MWAPLRSSLASWSSSGAPLSGNWNVWASCDYSNNSRTAILNTTTNSVTGIAQLLNQQQG